MRNRRVIAAAGAAVAILTTVVFLLVRDPKDVDVTTSEVTSGTIARQVLATGTLEPARTVDVGSQVSGTIQSIEVDFSAPVRAGQVIARIDPANYQAQLEAARAAQDQAKALAALADTAYQDARAKFDRAEELAAKSLIPTAELDAARVTMLQAQAELRARQADIKLAQARAEQAQVDLSHTVIRAPIDGLVINRNIEVGQTVSATVESPLLFTIADLRKMNLLAEVNEGEVAGARTGAPVTFRIESLGDDEFTGRLTEVRLQPYAEQSVATTGSNSGPAPSSSAAPTTGTTQTSPSSATAPTSGTSTGTPSGTSTPTTSTTTAGAGTAAPASQASPGAVSYTAVIEVDNAEGRLTPGGTAIINMPGAQRANVVRIPNNALSFRPDPAVLAELGQSGLRPDPIGPSGLTAGSKDARVAHVWRYDADQQRFVPLTVEVGLSDETWTELVSGPVQPGDRLATRAAVTKR